MRNKLLFLALFAVGGCVAQNSAPVGESQQALGSTGLVISQIYGGDGNTTPPFSSDFVVLFNRGTAAASTAGLSIQYASATGLFSSTTDIFALPTASIPAGGNYLVTFFSDGTGTATVTGDAVGPTTLNIAATTGKVALVTTALDACGSTATPCTAGAWVDLVGYGPSATTFEGTGPAATGATADTEFRAKGGCTDTDDNSADVAPAAATAPPTAATTATPCSTTTPPDLTMVKPADLTMKKPEDMTGVKPADMTGAGTDDAGADTGDGGDMAIVHVGGGPQDLAHTTIYPTQNGCSIVGSSASDAARSWLVILLLAIPVLLRRRRNA